MTKSKKNLGQYFTPQNVAEFMVGLIGKNVPPSTRILEPCAGHGVFLEQLSKKGFNNVVGYEIDSSLRNNSQVRIRYEDFLSSDPNDKFSVVIGNPPYVRWKNIPKEFKEVLHSNPYWTDKLNGLGDLLYAFIYLCVDKLLNNGELIFITPMFWTETMHAKTIRKWLSSVGEIETIVTFNEIRIFKEVSSTIIIFKFIKKKVGKPVKIVHLHSKQHLTREMLEHVESLLNRLDLQEYIQEGFYEAYLHPQFTNGNPWQMIPPHVKPIIEKMEKACMDTAPLVATSKSSMKQLPLSALLEEEDLEQFELNKKSCDIVRFGGKSYYLPTSQGTHTLPFTAGTGSERSNIRRYTRLGDIAHIGNGLVTGLDKAFKIDSETAFDTAEKQKLIPVVKARNLRKYFVTSPTPYIFVNDVPTETDLKTSFPGIFKHLSQFRTELEKRYQYGGSIPWWHWVFLRNFNLIEGSNEKILVPCKERIDQKGFVRFGLAKGRLYATQDVTVIVKKPEFKEDIRFILGILNSDIVLTWLKYKGLMRGGVIEFSERPLARIPIRLIDWGDPQDVQIHDEITQLVSKIIDTRRHEPYQKQIETLVRRLYRVD